MTFVPVPRGTEPPHTCLVCERGCGCTLDGPGCGHYGCWGRTPTRDCPGVDAEEARYAAQLSARRAADARMLSTRDRLAATYRAAIAAGIVGILSR